VPNNLNDEIRESYQQAAYQHAAHRARQADAQTDAKVKEQFLELRRLWLLLAHSHEFTESHADFSNETKRH
jgi:hypothetical protein